MYELIETRGVPIKAWVSGIPCDEAAKRQLSNVATLPFLFKWVAAMPDVHHGRGSIVGCVLATKGAVIPAAVGVDIGCGMSAVRTSLHRGDLPNGLANVRAAIERAIPHGRTNDGGRGDAGAWQGAPARVQRRWDQLLPGYHRIVEANAGARHRDPECQLGTLGTGNHFVEICVDESDHVWFILHSGSRGAGNRIGTYFSTVAQKSVARSGVRLADRDLAYLNEGTPEYEGYVEAVEWAQEYARINRELMMEAMTDAVRREVKAIPRAAEAIDCHHNSIAHESHFGEDVLVTRKGAVRARSGDRGIIPGSMGVRSYIVRGLGNPESFQSCSHAAGRAMACEPIDAVMAAQTDLVEVEHTLRQVVCVKG